MADKTSNKPSPKQKVVAFKVEAELASILDQLPNKSEFIRKAIAAQLGLACPLCRGEGVVSRELHDRAEEALRRMSPRGCHSCGGEMEVPVPSGELSKEDKDRLQQFFFGGPLYCHDCYEQAPACGDCGWHIDNEHFGEHQEREHATDA